MVTTHKNHTNTYNPHTHTHTHTHTSCTVTAETWLWGEIKRGAMGDETQTSYTHIAHTHLPPHTLRRVFRSFPPHVTHLIDQQQPTSPPTERPVPCCSPLCGPRGNGDVMEWIQSIDANLSSFFFPGAEPRGSRIEVRVKGPNSNLKQFSGAG